MNYLKLSGLGKTKLKRNLPIDEYGLLTAELYKSGVECKTEVKDVHLDELADRRVNKMLRVIARPKRLWVSNVSNGLQFEVLKLEYQSVVCPRTPSEESDGEPELED